MLKTKKINKYKLLSRRGQRHKTAQKNAMRKNTLNKLEKATTGKVTVSNLNAITGKQFARRITADTEAEVSFIIAKVLQEFENQWRAKMWLGKQVSAKAIKEAIKAITAEDVEAKTYSNGQTNYKGLLNKAVATAYKTEQKAQKAGALVVKATQKAEAKNRQAVAKSFACWGGCI